MHGAALFCFGAGRDRRKFFGVGQARAVVKSSGRGGATVKLGAFLGRGRAVLKIFWARAVRGNQGVAGRAGRASLA